MLSLIRERWRQDRLPILLFLITFVVMSYPFVFRMHDSLPMAHEDTHTAVWQNWWMREALSQGKTVTFSELLFHPQGLDLTFQPRRWTSFPLWTVLYSAFGDPLAFNLTAAFGVLLKAYGMYLFGLTIFGLRAPAWVAGAFYAFSAPSLALALQQPNTGATEWIPWFMLAFTVGIEQLGKQAPMRAPAATMLLAGLLFSLNTYMNIKIAVFAMLLGGAWLCLRTIQTGLWRRRRYWQGLSVFALFTLLLCAPLLLPSLQAQGTLDAVSGAVVAGRFGGVDVLAYLKSDYSKPLYYMNFVAALAGDRLSLLETPYDLSHMGLLCLVAAMAGVFYGLKRERAVLAWLILAVGFWLLSLGLNIHLGGQHLEAIYWTPYRLVEDNIIFQFLRWPHRFVLLFVFPFSLLVGYGLRFRLESMRWNRSGRAMLALFVMLLLYGTSMFPLPVQPIPRSAHLSALAKLPGGAVVDLPMGRQESKYYMSVQRFHQRPLVEGTIARMPAGAYDYIESNPLLAALRAKSGENRLPPLSQHDWRQSMAALEEAGFRYLVLHKKVPLTYAWPFVPPYDEDDLLLLPRPIYADDEALIFDIGSWTPGNLLIQTGFWGPMPDEGAMIAVGDHFRLHGWSLLDAIDAQPCQTLRVESWWELAEAEAGHNTLELILAQAGGNGQVAISKKAPADRPTSDWQTGIVYRDEASLRLPCELADGEYPLLLGMINSETWESHQFRLPDGGSAGTLYYLTTLNVRMD